MKIIRVVKTQRAQIISELTTEISNKSRRILDSLPPRNTRGWWFIASPGLICIEGLLLVNKYYNASVQISAHYQKHDPHRVWIEISLGGKRIAWYEISVEEKTEDSYISDLKGEMSPNEPSLLGDEEIYLILSSLHIQTAKY
jgi:hypothetical protein